MEHMAAETLCTMPTFPSRNVRLLWKNSGRAGGMAAPERGFIIRPHE